MILLGITGSIGMGKSTVARQFQRFGIPVFDADRAVHRLFATDKKTREMLKKHFTEAIVGGTVNRRIRGEIVL